MRLGLLPGCVDPGDMPKADPVEDRGFFDRAGGEGLVLALKNSKVIFRRHKAVAADEIVH